MHWVWSGAWHSASLTSAHLISICGLNSVTLNNIETVSVFFICSSCFSSNQSTAELWLTLRLGLTYYTVEYPVCSVHLCFCHLGRSFTCTDSTHHGSWSTVASTMEQDARICGPAQVKRVVQGSIIHIQCFSHGYPLLDPHLPSLMSFGLLFKVQIFYYPTPRPRGF